MGFYGNIVNSAKASFTFDQVYSNRYIMDMSVGMDKVMVGRYVLVEYDQKYAVDASPSYYFYNNRMYSSLLKRQFENIEVIAGAQADNEFIPVDEEELLVRVPIGFKAANLVTGVQYAQIADTKGNVNFITKNAYNQYLQSQYVHCQDVTASNYVLGKFFLRTDEFDEKLNDIVVTYEREASHILVNNVTAEDLVRYSDLSDLPNQDDELDIFYVWVEEDQLYAPIGNCVSSYYSYIDEDNKESWDEWWHNELFPYRKKLYDNSLNTTKIAENKYYRLNHYNEYADYYLPRSEIFYPVELLTDEYKPNVYYTCSDANPTYSSQFKLATEATMQASAVYYTNDIAHNLAYVLSGKLVTIPVVEHITQEMSDKLALLPGQCIMVGAFHAYETNLEDEFYLYKNGQWRKLNYDVHLTSEDILVGSADTTYLLNMAIDMARYNSARGYDSTVWQKVSSHGVEKYVMVAELNSVVPTFDVGVDAPTLSPLVPHFDADSTNVYYKLHWQPQWGMRVKAASNTLKGPRYDENGTYVSGNAVFLRRQSDTTDAFDHITDDVFYPSDEEVAWQFRDYDSKTGKFKINYYNVNTGNLDDQIDEESPSSYKVPAAIYYNKDGFDAKKIAYSGDLIATDDDDQPMFGERYNASIAESGWKDVDKVDLTPTGQSGKIYNPHDGSADRKPSEDTQEFSMMLPSLGNTIAKIWDLVYGGRDTNEIIAATNVRNQDIEWEEGRETLDRRGLRLVHDGDENSYAKAEINTIAGAINSAHDIMGMIISSNSRDRLDTDIESLSDDRIYFSTDDNKYFRRHLTYDYTPVDATDPNTFNYVIDETVKKDDFDPKLYYTRTPGGIMQKVADDASYIEGTDYYIRSNETYMKVDFDEFKPDEYYYLDYTGVPELDANPEDNLDMMNYCKDAEYLPAHQYYTIDPAGIVKVSLDDAYEAGKYYYYDGERYIKDYSDIPTKGVQYFSINDDKVLKVLNNSNAGNYQGIYVPGRYYTQQGTNIYKLHNDTIFNPELKYYLPLIEDKADEDVTDDETGEIITPETEYVKEIIYEPVVPMTQEELDNNQKIAQALGSASFYYIKDTETEGVYNPYKGLWADWTTTDERVQLYTRSERYFEASKEQIYTLDELSEVKLVGFSSDSYWVREYDTKSGKFTGFRPATRLDIIPKKDEKPVEIVAFGYGIDFDGTTAKTKPWCNDLNTPFMLASGVNINDHLDWAVKKLHEFYVPEIYHFEDEKHNYLLDKYKRMTRDNYFYFLEDAIHYVDLSNALFYEPYKYYKKGSSGEYVLAREPKQEPGVEYFKKAELFVYEDSRGIMRKGTVWNSSALTIPEGVVLATREERYELKEIPGFARNLNTMHGLLLKMNRYMEYDDEYTRDERIGNGLLNKVKDILVNIGNFTPRTLLSIDDAGRLLETHWDTRQEDTFNQDKVEIKSLLKDVEGDVFEKANTVEQMRKQWLTVNLDGTPDKPTLRVHHNFQPVQDDPQTWDMNDRAGDTVELFFPIVDGMGHIVGNKNQTVTLPYNFKSLIVNDASTGVTDLTAAAGTIVANNTKANLTFAPGNKWVKLNANPATDTLTIGHEVHAFTSGKANTQYGLAANETITTLDADNTFEVPNFTFDEAGHITSAETHTVTIPENFLSVETAMNSDVTFSTAHSKAKISATGLQDNLILAEGNRWINLIADVNNKTITVEHAAAGSVSKEKGDSLAQTPVFGGTFKALSVGIDQAGHVSSLEEHTVTIPKMSLADDTGNVMTGLSLVESTGAFTITKRNVGTLQLTGYQPLRASTLDDITAVNENDSINQAIAKLQARCAVDEAQHSYDFTQLSNAIPVITLDDDGVLTIKNGLKTDYTINNITQETEFLYTEDKKNSSNNVYVTIAELTTKVAELEARLAELEK